MEVLKVLVATKETQGERKQEGYFDYCECNEGELVRFGCNPISGIDMTGIDTLQQTTTFKVVEVDILEEEFLERIHRSVVFEWSRPDSDLISATNKAKLLQISEQCLVGTVLEKHGESFFVRQTRTKEELRIQSKKEIMALFERSNAEMAQTLKDQGIQIPEADLVALNKKILNKVDASFDDFHKNR